MLYVKLPRGAGRWTIIEAEQVDTDGVQYEMPIPPEAGPGEVKGLDIPAELHKKEVELREHVEILDVSRLFYPEMAWHDSYVKVVHTFDGKAWRTHVFQGDGYVMGESGGTIEKL